jgi:hypothetical protein
MGETEYEHQAGPTVKSGRANHWRGFEAVGGRLTVTVDSIVFVPHRINFQREVMRWDRKDLVRAAVGAARGRLVLAFSDGSEEQFVVFRRDAWVAALAPSGA